MKKVASILAIMALTLGMFSCEPENTAQETDALYGTIDNNNNSNPAQATDEEEAKPETRG